MYMNLFLFHYGPTGVLPAAGVPSPPLTVAFYIPGT